MNQGSDSKIIKDTVGEYDTNGKVSDCGGQVVGQLSCVFELYRVTYPEKCCLTENVYNHLVNLFSGFLVVFESQLSDPGYV